MKDKEAVIGPNKRTLRGRRRFRCGFPDSNGFGGAVFSGLLYLFQILQVPMTGKNSIAQMVIVLGELSGMGTFAVTYVRIRRRIAWA